MSAQRVLLLLDNGSSRAASTRALRRLAAALGARVGESVHPVSLQHADKVPATDLDGHPANTFGPFLWEQAGRGNRRFLVLPLFFGPSRALTDWIPEQVALIGADLGPLELRMARVLCPLPPGEPRLGSLLYDHLEACARAAGFRPRRVVLVDHGSPTPEVAAVRNFLAGELRRHLAPGVRLEEAAMERRAGAAYDFNGELLAEVLRRLAREDRASPVMLSLLFLFAGRHAGAGGDIARICRAVEAEFPDFRVYQSPLVGEHPALVELLQRRLEETEE